ncbi:hypothetical protein ADK99_07185, partial [Streptomyces sp. MMG1064]
LDVEWTAGKVLLVPVMLLAGGSIFAAGMVAGAAFPFIAGGAGGGRNSFPHGGREDRPPGQHPDPHQLHFPLLPLPVHRPERPARHPQPLPEAAEPAQREAVGGDLREQRDRA